MEVITGTVIWYNDESKYVVLSSTKVVKRYITRDGLPDGLHWDLGGKGGLKGFKNCVM